ncbi:MAG: alpha/beta fold hydrolase [Acidimicrobiia bacterium]|nr:alpha/beta fold hydrolase [Acidimicrobiia bacterium]
MPIAHLRNTDIFYETFGDAADQHVLLIAGLGGQLLVWETEFCRRLADTGTRVIRFDNRDVGLSTMFDDAELDLSMALSEALAGRAIEVPYTLSDMAGDALGLMDHLGIERAHLVGVSMGGMIAQTLAAEHPDRVASLTSIMSSTGSRMVGQATPAAIAVLFERPPTDRDGAIDASMQAQRVIGSPAYFDTEAARAHAGAAYDRSFNPEGSGRQLAAIYAAGNRSDQVAAISTPTLVIHGAQDPLVDISGGRHTAEIIPGAELLIIDDMGHDLPRPLWDKLIEAISAHVRTASTP